MNIKRIRSALPKFLIAGCLSISLGLFMPAPQGAKAHSILVRSDPEAGTALAQAPQTVTLEFTEALDPDFSKARLVDSDLNVLAEGPGIIDPQDNRVLRLSLPVLPTGAYNVIWQVRSAVDGHITNGVVTFTVGEAVSNVSLLPPPGAPDPTTARPPLMDTILRWLNYFAAALAAGSFLFGWLVWRPAYRAWEDPDPRSDRFAALRLRQIARIGILSLAGLSVGFLLFQAWEASQGVFQISYRQALAELLSPRRGWIFWLRMGLLGLLLLQTRRLSPPGEGSTTIWWGSTILIVAVLLTFSMQSHAAALGSPLAVAADWFHITAMTAWLGGLLPLFLFLLQKKLPPHLLVPRFSRLALVCVAVLAISGFYSAFIEVRTLQALVSTLYGQALAFKTALFAIIVGLGAVNLLILSPRLKSSWEKATGWLGKTVRVELAVGALILALAGLMTGVSPSLEAIKARQRMGFIGEYKDKGAIIQLWIAPTRVGENEIAVDVYGLPSGHHAHQHTVLLNLQPVGADLGLTQVEAIPDGDTRYQIKGSYLTVAGDWQVEVILRQPGADDIRHVFTVAVQPAAQGMVP